MFCNKCGSVLNEEATFCSKCGARHIRKQKEKKLFVGNRINYKVIGIIVLFIVGEIISLSVIKNMENIAKETKEKNQIVYSQNEELKTEISLKEMTLNEFQQKIKNSEEEIQKTEQELITLKENKLEISQQKIEKMKEEMKSSLFETQEYIQYIFDEYYFLGTGKHIYESENLADILKGEIIANVSLRSSTLENGVNTFVDGMVEGKGIVEVRDEILQNGSTWITEEVTSYIGEKLLGSTLLGLLNTVKTIAEDKPQVMYLASQLENDIQQNYFSCFYQFLALEEWDDELFFECVRRSDELQYMLRKIEEYTGDDVGSELWRGFYYCFDVDAIDYYGNQYLLECLTGEK